jgi:hypothetical protein
MTVLSHWPNRGNVLFGFSSLVPGDFASITGIDASLKPQLLVVSFFLELIIKKA